MAKGGRPRSEYVVIRGTVHQPPNLAQEDIMMSRVPLHDRVRQEPPDLAEKCLDDTCQSPWIIFALCLLAGGLLVLLLGIYFLESRYILSVLLMVIAGVIIVISLCVLAFRGSHNRRAVKDIGRPYLPGHVQALTPMVRWHSDRDEVTIEVRNPYATSSADAVDPDVPGPSGLQPPVLPISDEHFSRTLRSGKKTPGIISPRSERQRFHKDPAAGDSSRRRKVSEGDLSPIETGAKSVSRRKKISSRRLSIHE